MSSTDTSEAAVALPVAEFVGTCGQNSFATCAGGAPLGSQIAVNNNTDLSGCVQFNDKGCVYGMTFIKAENGIYSLEVVVDAQGPSGTGSGYGHLKFVDDAGTTAKLKIWDSSRGNHTCQWQSNGSKLVSFYWTD